MKLELCSNLNKQFEDKTIVDTQFFRWSLYIHKFDKLLALSQFRNRIWSF